MATDPQNSQRTVDQFLINALSQWHQTSGDIRGFLGTSGYGEDAAADISKRAKYYPQPGESYDRWLTRLDKDFPGISDMLGVGTGDPSKRGPGFEGMHANVAYKTQAVMDYLSGKTWEGKAGSEQRGAVQKALGLSGNETPEEIKAKGDAYLKQVQTLQGQVQGFRQAAGFADPNKPGSVEDVPGTAVDTAPSGVDVMREYARHMMSPLDQNDPYVQSIISASAGAASRDASSHGLHGGMATSNVAQGVTNALNATQMQRGQLGTQAMLGAEGLNMQQAQMMQDQYNHQWQAQQAGLAAQYASGKAQNQGMWGTVGGIGGGIIGGYFGGPAGAQAGMTAGSQLVAGLAGANYGAAPQVAYNPPALGYQSRGRGGLGGNY